MLLRVSGHWKNKHNKLDINDVCGLNLFRWIHTTSNDTFQHSTDRIYENEVVKKNFESVSTLYCAPNGSGKVRLDYMPSLHRHSCLLLFPSLYLVAPFSHVMRHSSRKTHRSPWDQTAESWEQCMVKWKILPHGALFRRVHSKCTALRIWWYGAYICWTYETHMLNI